MRVVIADDHPVVIMGLRAALKGHGSRFQVVGEADSGMALIAMLPTTPCDLVITDFAMSDAPDAQDGLVMLKRLQRSHPRLPILVLTMLDNPALIQGMLGTGVRGIVDKMAMTAELMRAIDAIIAGRIYLSDRVRELLRAAALLGDASRDLSPKEAEVVRLFSQGLSVSEIAHRTSRSVTTISQQKREAMRKLGLENDKQLHEYAGSSGLS